MGERKKVNISFSSSIDVNAVVDLYRESKWFEGEEEQMGRVVRSMIEKSYRFATLWSDHVLIGMGRAISDGVSDAYIQDVYVTQTERGHGYGKDIIRALVDELRRNEIGWIALVAEPGTTPFYRGLGFDVMNDHVPMRLVT